MASTLTWDDVLKNKDLIGGDIESQEDGDIYRGPLKEIKKEGNSIVFTCDWIAKRDSETGKWTKWNITQTFVNSDLIKPHDIGSGRIFYSVPMSGVTTIFPRGGSKLDPAKVEGV